MARICPADITRLVLAGAHSHELVTFQVLKDKLEWSTKGGNVNMPESLLSNCPLDGEAYDPITVTADST